MAAVCRVDVREALTATWVLKCKDSKDTYYAAKANVYLLRTD